MAAYEPILTDLESDRLRCCRASHHFNAVAGVVYGELEEGQVAVNAGEVTPMDPTPPVRGACSTATP